LEKTIPAAKGISILRQGLADQKNFSLKGIFKPKKKSLFGRSGSKDQV
jgi:hypothetical protein